MLFASAILLASSVFADQQDLIILEARNLPPLTLSILKTYFPETQIVKAQKLDSKVKNSFELWLDDGTYMHCDKDGQWQYVDCGDEKVPERMIPPKVRLYLQQYYPTAAVVKMIKDKKGYYEIYLYEGKMLYFDNQFKFKKVE